MLFSSITFLYFFMPFMAIYYVLPKKMKNAFLLITSLFFYFFGEPVYVLLLLLSSVSDWVHGLYIDAHRGKKSAKVALVSSIVVNLLMLGFFKYTDFIIGTINSAFGTNIPLLGIALPIGISFFTFQTMSYTIDVYRGRAKLQRNFATFATYVSLFPQLIAGPIVRYTDVENELENRKITLSGVSDGILRFSVGLGKKVLIANLLGEFCSNFIASDEKSVVFYWLYAAAFAMQVYFDFSGYSDMAIGLGKMLGFSFPENFNYPFISKNATEFWRRWHMTLGSWFRDYVYIPMGGNRVSTLKWIRNIVVVWLLTGIWHGAEWNFVLWGAMFGLLLLVEKFWIKELLNRVPTVFSYVYTIFVILVSFTIFNANGLSGVIADFSGMLGFSGLPAVSNDMLYNLRSYFVLFAIALTGATPAPKLLWNKLPECVKSVAEPIFAVIILLVSTAFLINGSFNPFLYFRF